jgi:hypothetical protein
MPNQAQNVPRDALSPFAIDQTARPSCGGSRKLRVAGQARHAPGGMRNRFGAEGGIARVENRPCASKRADRGTLLGHDGETDRRHSERARFVQRHTAANERDVGLGQRIDKAGPRREPAGMAQRRLRTAGKSGRHVHGCGGTVIGEGVGNLLRAAAHVMAATKRHDDAWVSRWPA